MEGINFFFPSLLQASKLRLLKPLAFLMSLSCYKGLKAELFSESEAKVFVLRIFMYLRAFCHSLA